jgi:hypothetical protein
LRRRRLKVSLIRERILLVLRQTVTPLPVVFLQLAILSLNRHLTKHSNLLLLLSPLLWIQLLTQLEVRQMQRPRRDQHLPPIR